MTSREEALRELVAKWINQVYTHSTYLQREGRLSDAAELLAILDAPAEDVPIEVEERYIGTSREMDRALQLDQRKLDSLMAPAEEVGEPLPKFSKMVGTEALGNGNDHFGEHNENSFCRQRGCVPARPAAKDGEK